VSGQHPDERDAQQPGVAHRLQPLREQRVGHDEGRRGEQDEDPGVAEVERGGPGAPGRR
jgi:hypothetical protein